MGGCVKEVTHDGLVHYVCVIGFSHNRLRDSSFFVLPYLENVYVEGPTRDGPTESAIFEGSIWSSYYERDYH